MLLRSLLTTQGAIAQTPTERPAANGGAVTPNTPDSHPDLQGVWPRAASPRNKRSPRGQTATAIADTIRAGSATISSPDQHGRSAAETGGS
jgi:hypothetical protein